MRLTFPFTSIWERYFLREMFKIFTLFLLGFYGLYVLIDYSTHTRSFQNYHFTFLEVVSYYIHDFVARIDVLVPFAILIACIKTLCSLNSNNELVALLTGGIKLKRLLLPFIGFGLLFTALMYFNIEVLQPQALKYHKQLGHRRAEAKQKRHNHPHIQQLTLQDGSSLIFRNFDELNEAFEDVYWVRSIDDIYRIETLTPYTQEPVGTNVEHFLRGDDGTLAITEFNNKMLFPGIHFDSAKLLESVTTPNDLSISALYERLPQTDAPLSEKEARTLTTYYYKLAMPWLCLLAVIAPAPFCVRFSRSLPIFFIYALSLFGLVAFYLTMDAAVVLGERQVISPAAAIWIPFATFFSFFSIRYIRAT